MKYLLVAALALSALGCTDLPAGPSHQPEPAPVPRRDNCTARPAPPFGYKLVCPGD